MEWLISSWSLLRGFIVNARLVEVADSSLLKQFVNPSQPNPVVVGGLPWASYHHAAVYLGVEVLYAVESGIRPMKVTDIPTRGALPAATLAAIRSELQSRQHCDFDPDTLRQNLGCEAASVGINTPYETWRPARTVPCNQIRFIPSNSPTPADDAQPTGIATLHINCFLMLSALCSFGPRVQPAMAEPPTESATPAPKGKRESRRQQQMKRLAPALALVNEHPDWSDAAIAEATGYSPSALSRNHIYQAAAEMARGDKSSLSKGFIRADRNGRRATGDVEAINPES